MKLLLLIFVVMILETCISFRFPVNKFPKYSKLLQTNIESETPNSENQIANSIEIPVDETPEEKYKREKLAEIAEKKALEVFVTRNTGKFECQACGYIYNEAVGLPNKGIAAGTLFADIEKFRCPACGANKKYFVEETETLSGFKVNQKYGLGANTMTGESKTSLIFGGLGIMFALLMSGYLME